MSSLITVDYCRQLRRRKKSKCQRKESTRLLKCWCKLEVRYLIFFRNNGNFVTAGTNGNIALWQSKQIVKTVNMFKVNSKPIMKRNASEIVATGETEKVCVLNDELEIKQQFNGYDKTPRSIDFDKKYIIIGYSGGMVHLHNRRNNDRKEVKVNLKDKSNLNPQINSHDSSVCSVCLNQHYAISASNDTTIQVYSLAMRKTVKTLNHSKSVYCVSFGPISTWLASKLISCSGDKTLRIWNVENGKTKDEFKHDNWCWSFDIDQNGDTLAVACDKVVSIWSIRDHRKMADIKTDSYAMDVRFNKFNNTIVAGCNKGGVYKITL